jgi:hypothetical protein
MTYYAILAVSRVNRKEEKRKPGGSNGLSWDDNTAALSHFSISAEDT